MEENVTAFEENLQRWSLFCPKAAAAIREFGIDKSPFKMVEKEGRPFNLQTTIADKVYFFHDPENPAAEAKAMMQQIDFGMCDILYVYGLGLGYLFDELKEWLQDPKHSLVIFEDQLVVIDFFFHTERAKEFLGHPRCWLYYLSSDVKEFDAYVRMFALQKPQVSGLPLYQQLYKRRFDELKIQLAFIKNIQAGHINEFQGFGIGFFINYFHNLFAWPKAYLGDGLFNKFASVPAIICGAGPSLAKNINFLKTLGDKAIIFAGGTSMNVLNAKGVIPHFGIGIDPNFEQSTRIIMNKAFDTPF